ncbi:hypothetical protein EYF80_001881 [Liparis tanakae]|uniref:Uncharacterized protein n=1 Tax=Liparis tanakae TaxID=230148 RepID=A0A4Z2JD64_9TELE|nr:hypothetical protein EYF80_001881 [Liparis tanakae]
MERQLDRESKGDGGEEECGTVYGWCPRRLEDRKRNGTPNPLCNGRLERGRERYLKKQTGDE